ncbi:MAG: nucleotidyltransferase [Alphaproteobacteria bacterium HGW-Alphaproteobacteria-6]|nr:MAG: nucleotidyltransferase [Alphaproteobacteria bacterium HGW-Alphaproteobacteria-6]
MRPEPDALMLYAAGFGTRMGALAADRPKPLIAVAGRALIDHALDIAGAAGIGRIVVNLHYRGEQIRAHLSGRADIRFSPEEAPIAETGGGLKLALPLLGPGPVFTLNSDAVWTGANPLTRLRDAWDPARMEALLLLVPKPRATGHPGPGDFAMAADGRLTRGGDLVYSGAGIIATDRLAAMSQRCFSLNPVWDRMAADGGLFGLLHPGGWCDVGRPEAIALAEAVLTAEGRADV